jgi:TctA family transporter
VATLVIIDPVCIAHVVAALAAVYGFVALTDVADFHISLLVGLFGLSRIAAQQRDSERTLTRR